MDEIKDRLSLALKIKEKSAKDLSDLTNIPKSSISQYMSGYAKPKSDRIHSIAKALHINEAWLLGYDVPMDKSDIIKQLEPINMIFDDYFPLHYCTNLSAGSPTELFEAEPDAVVYVPIKFQNRKKRLHAFQVNGTSMNNVIPDGAIVVAEEVPDTVLKEGTIVVAWINGEATVKRIYPGEHQVTLMPDSSDKGHHPIIINADEEQVYILGRVIWHMNPDNISEYY
jgi:repressor LexA